MIEIYKVPQGKITILLNDANLSIGSLKLDPNGALPKHNRPVKEQLTQIQGLCVVKLFDGDKLLKEVTLEENDRLDIPANQFHIHSNPFSEDSITLWKFEGDIREVNDGIRNSYEKVL